MQPSVFLNRRPGGKTVYNKIILFYRDLDAAKVQNKKVNKTYKFVLPRK